MQRSAITHLPAISRSQVHNDGKTASRSSETAPDAIRPQNATERNRTQQNATERNRRRGRPPARMQARHGAAGRNMAHALTTPPQRVKAQQTQPDEAGAISRGEVTVAAQ